MNMVEVNRNFEGVGLTSKEEKANHFAKLYSTIFLFAVPYILAQGFWAVLFNRRSPAEARNIFFRILSQVPLSRKRATYTEKGRISTVYQPGRHQINFAWFCATLAYLWALFILVLCPIMFVVHVIATEIELHTLPQSENNNHIGQWQPWAGTILVLLAAAIAQFHQDGKKLLNGIANYIFWKVGHWWKHRRGQHEAGDYSEEADLYGKPGLSGRPNMQRKVSVYPDQSLYSDTKHAIEDIILDVWDEFIWYLRDAKNLVIHEYLLFIGWYRVPYMRRKDSSLHSLLATLLTISSLEKNATRESRGKEDPAKQATCARSANKLL